MKAKVWKTQCYQMLKQKLPNFFEMCPKSSQRSLPKLKCVSFQNSPKGAKHLGLFGKIFFAKTFQNRSNLVSLERRNGGIWNMECSDFGRQIWASGTRRGFWCSVWKERTMINHLFSLSKIFNRRLKSLFPWSSGYGRRLMFRRSWVRIPALYTG